MLRGYFFKYICVLEFSAFLSKLRIASSGAFSVLRTILLKDAPPLGVVGASEHLSIL